MYNYKNVFDPSIGFMRGKGVDGKWQEPFDPLEFKYYMSIPHPSVLHSKHFLNKGKMFDTNYKRSGDYELIYSGILKAFRPAWGFCSIFPRAVWKRLFRCV